MSTQEANPRLEGLNTNVFSVLGLGSGALDADPPERSPARAKIILMSITVALLAALASVVVTRKLIDTQNRTPAVATRVPQVPSVSRGMAVLTGPAIEPAPPNWARPRAEPVLHVSKSDVRPAPSRRGKPSPSEALDERPVALVVMAENQGSAETLQPVARPEDIVLRPTQQDVGDATNALRILRQK